MLTELTARMTSLPVFGSFDFTVTTHAPHPPKLHEIGKLQSALKWQK